MSQIKLTITVRTSGYVELLDANGVWHGPGVGGFPSTAAARDWARRSGYRVARTIARNA